MKRTAGRWNQGDRNIYFVANVPSAMSQTAKMHDFLLVAINEFNDDYQERVNEWIANDKKVFIDSGVFNLASEHARRNNVSHNVALSMAPGEIDGFDKLFDKYCSILGRIGDNCWGYIEIDQGGRENKIKTRKRLESMGFRPIPVYHPMNDGWDYFDELASTYDRICVGNLVQAERDVRKRIIATIWERKQAYPNLWIHLLGVTPNQTFSAYPMESSDSSSITSITRYGSTSGFNDMALQTGSPLPRGYVYEQGQPEGEGGYYKAHRFVGYVGSFMSRTWGSVVREYQERGLI